MAEQLEGTGCGGSLPCEACPCQGSGDGGRSLALPLGRCRALLTTLIPKLKTHRQAVREAGRPGHSPGARVPHCGGAGGGDRHSGPLSLLKAGRAGTFPGPPLNT